MANEECKTTIISYDERERETSVTKDDSSIRNVLFNVTTKVPHVAQTLPTAKVETTAPTKKIDHRSIQNINKHADAIPKFYLQEYKRSKMIAVAWGILTLICLAFEIWAMIEIFNKPINNWVCLTLIPPITLCIAFLIVYLNNWINFRNEARCVDFTQGKIPTISVMKLYKRLKTAHINVNWFCGLTYVAGGLIILIIFIIGWAISIKFNQPQWGVLDPNFEPYKNTCGAALLITVIICSVAMITAFLMHVILLVTNYVRAGKIDSFYSVQIVSDEELIALKKKKNKRDFFIFLAVIMIIVLIGFLIYRLIKSRKVNNTVTINN